MATELVTFTWCDIHQDKGDRVLGQPWTLVVVAPDDKRRASERMVDLCDDCASDLGLVAMRELVDEYGRDTAGHVRPSRSKRATTPAGRTAPAADDAGELIGCPRCDKAYADRNKLSAHARRVHEVSLGELLGEPTPYACHCGKEFGREQGLRVHQTRSHGA